MGDDKCERIHSPIITAEIDAATKGVAIGVTMGVRHVLCDWLNSNYLVKANFRIKITKVWSRRNAWALAGTFGQNCINQKIELESN